MDFTSLLWRRAPTRCAELAGVTLFSGLTPAELAVVRNLLHLREYVADEVVFDQGETGHALYLVLAGEVSIRDPMNSRGADLARLGPGEFFGELGLLDESTRTAQVRALRDCRLAILFREDFTDLMDSHLRIAHKIGRQLLRHLGERLRLAALCAGEHRHS